VTTVPEDSRAVCRVCGAGCADDDRFCENCGASLQDETLTPASGSTDFACTACGGDEFDRDGFCIACGLHVVEKSRATVDLGVLAGVTDRGNRYHRNEDAMALQWLPAPAGAIVVICDGVSTSDDADAAARVAADEAAATLCARLREGTNAAAATHDAVAAAAAAVTRIGVGRGEDRSPACTFVSAVVRADAITVGSVGDSRAYWLTAASGGTPSQCLTVDDSWAADMISAGVLDRATAMANPQAHALTAWLGVDAGRIEPHVSTLVPDGPGVVLVCTDGLWNYLDEADALAARILPAALQDPAAGAAELADFALAAGGRDNITVALVPFPPNTARQRSNVT
jgi:serine/threonine protein phosphatase PrpC